MAWSIDQIDRYHYVASGSVQAQTRTNENGDGATKPFRELRKSYGSEEHVLAKEVLNKGKDPQRKQLALNKKGGKTISFSCPASSHLGQHQVKSICMVSV